MRTQKWEIKAAASSRERNQMARALSGILWFIIVALTSFRSRKFHYSPQSQNAKKTANEKELKSIISSGDAWNFDEDKVIDRFCVPKFNYWAPKIPFIAFPHLAVNAAFNFKRRKSFWFSFNRVLIFFFLFLSRKVIRTAGVEVLEGEIICNRNLFDCSINTRATASWKRDHVVRKQLSRVLRCRLCGERRVESRNQPWNYQIKRKTFWRCDWIWKSVEPIQRCSLRVFIGSQQTSRLAKSIKRQFQSLGGDTRFHLP